MSTPVPPSVVTPFAINGGKTDPIPVPSQIGTSPEIASFNDGFPPATRIPRTQGGIPPRGLDMNGILFMLSAHTSWVAAGGQYQFNADVVTVSTGYPVGAVLQSAVNPAQFYLNTVANNANDPDSVITGWLPFTLTAAPTGVQTPSTLAAGSQSIVTTPSVGFLELTGDGGGTSAILNITGGSNGQILVVSNVAAPFVTLLSSGNLRLPVDVTLLQNDSQAFRFSSALNLWVKM